MSTLLKDTFSPSFFQALCQELKAVIPNFSSNRFTEEIFTRDWESKELKQRMLHTTTVLHRYMPASFPAAAKLLDQLIARLQPGALPGGGLPWMFLPDYVEQYGIEHFGESVALFEKITQLVSCEFAVRPFLIRHTDAMIQQMIRWSKHPNHHVRRLASEGSRPRLPWAIALPAFKKDPRPALPILENLKRDPSDYVRRSVANHLNDIAKDNPQILIEFVRAWKGEDPQTDALLKHASRTLLKQGDPAILELYGLNARHLEVSAIKHKRKVKMGETLDFSFRLANTHKKPVTVRIEYAMYFLRQKDKFGRKVFKISERSLSGGETIEIRRRHAIRPITTRVYYPGEQRLSIIVNGRESEPVSFILNY
jgi:3-methyladenine DNA glycosylase AlkC